MLPVDASVEHFMASLKLTSTVDVFAVMAREIDGGTVSGTVICQKIP